MHPITVIASAIQQDPECPPVEWATEAGICAVTGMVEAATIPRKLLLGPSFTDGALLAAPGSDRVSVAAYKALRFKWERMSSWICDGETFVRLDRQGVRAAVFAEPPVRPWCGYATTSYKKHGAIRTKVNGPGRRIWLFETRLVDCSDMAETLAVWNKLNAALRLGFGRPALEAVECPPWLMAKVGIDAWRDFEAWALPLKQSALYAFMCYLLPSQEELKNAQSAA